MLFTVNILPLVLMFVLLARLVERFGTTDWGRIFVMAAATLGTLLNTFAVVLNNHIVAAVSAAVALYALVRISADGERRWRYFFAGRPGRRIHRRQRAARAHAFGLRRPAAALACAARNADRLRARRCRRRRRVSSPRTGSPTNSLRPPYMHRSETDPDDNWYNYTYTVNGQRAAKLLARPPGHRPRRADQIDVRAARARRPSRHLFAHADLAAERRRAC